MRLINAIWELIEDFKNRKDSLYSEWKDFLRCPQYDYFRMSYNHIKIEVKPNELIDMILLDNLRMPINKSYKKKRSIICEYKVIDIDNDKNIILQGYQIFNDPSEIHKFGMDLIMKYFPYEEYIEEYLLYKCFF